MKEKIIAPVRETPSFYDAIEERLIALFKREVYLPLVRLLDAPKTTLQNSDDPLGEAITKGKIRFSRGTFSGKFSAGTSKQLKDLGATWDKKSKTWKIRQADLPIEVRAAVSASEARLSEKISGIDRKLAGLSPTEITKNLQITKLFDTALWKVEEDFKDSVKGISVFPTLTKEQRLKIANEWSYNMDLWIQNFLDIEIVKLRKSVQETVYSGNRYESTLKAIQDSYGVSQNKAKFLARQETGLLMTKHQETRYLEAGSDEFIWGCVAGSPNHPVRPTHKILDGKRFRWDDPREIDEHGKFKPGGVKKPGNNLNPRQDFGCRCFPKPIVRF